MTRRLISRAGMVAFATASVLSCNDYNDAGVGPHVQSITISQKTMQAIVGDKATLTYVLGADPGASRVVAWKSSAPSVATVGSDGTVTAVAAGSAVITVYSVAEPERHDECAVVVRAPVVTGVIVTPSSASVPIGSSTTFTAVVAADPQITDRSVTWKSSSTAIAMVNQTGVVTGVTIGTATITATSNADATKHEDAVVTVTPISLTFINGTYGGAVNLTTNAATPGPMGLLPTCVGSTATYGQSLTISVDANGNGTAVPVDGGGLTRSYTISVSPSLTMSSSGTFSFVQAGVTAQIPGILNVTITGNTASFRESTEYNNNTCVNSYAGFLIRGQAAVRAGR